jgi:predicted small secreted protein
MNTNPHTIQRVTITAAIAVFAFTTAACGTE